MTFALNSLLIFYQLINNLLSRASRPGPRIGRRWKDLKHIRGRGFSPTPFLCFDLQLQAWCLWWWQKRSKYQPLFFLNFQKWCYKSSLYKANKKSKLIGRLSNFKNPFIPPCDVQVSDADNVLISPIRAMLLRENVLQNCMIDSWCHIWIQYRPYITILTFHIYVHRMFHLHPWSVCVKCIYEPAESIWYYRPQNPSILRWITIEQKVFPMDGSKGT